MNEIHERIEKTQRQMAAAQAQVEQLNTKIQKTTDTEAQRGLLEQEAAAAKEVQVLRRSLDALQGEHARLVSQEAEDRRTKWRQELGPQAVQELRVAESEFVNSLARLRLQLQKLEATRAYWDGQRRAYGNMGLGVGPENRAYTSLQRTFDHYRGQVMAKDPLVTRARKLLNDDIRWPEGELERLCGVAVDDAGGERT